MKYITAALFTLLFSCSVTAQEIRKEFSWLPLGLTTESSDVYFDSNGSKTINQNKNKGSYKTGILLGVFKKPITVRTEQGTKTSLSMASLVIMDCDSGMAAPIQDVYYSVKFPTRKDKSLGSVNYDSKDISEIAAVFPKDSAIYKVLCPVSI